ncbi:MAG: NUDIX hydrolase [Acidobacteriota bacterium]
MHRRPLLHLLARHRQRHPDDAARVDRFRAFVDAHPDCFDRALAIGHVTASAWIVDPSGTRALLLHHRKLDRWLQPGGHADGETDVLTVARSEVGEETGLTPNVIVREPASDVVDCFDVDIHAIPARPARGDRPAEPAHHHYDVRFAFRAGADWRRATAALAEAHALRWVPLDAVADYAGDDRSILRMCERWRAGWP